MFNWTDIKFFLELSRREHLSAVAGRLRVDISTVSRRVGELEKTLKCKLFERTPDRFVLSREGQKILAHAERMEASATAILDETREEFGAVRVAAMEGFADFVLAQKWSQFRIEHRLVTKA